MAIFSYKALTEKGKLEEASLSAGNKEEASLILQQRGLTPISIKTKQTRKFSLRSSVSLLEKISFVRYMALILQSGLSMSDGIEALAQETTNITMRRILNELSYGLRSGKAISAILENYPKVFDPVFISMIKAGEVSGKLAETFVYLTDKLRSEYELKRQVRGAMIYPIVIFLAMLSMGTVMIVFILPRIGEVFTSLNIQLPLPTRILLFTGAFLQAHIVYESIAVIVGLLSAFFFIPRTKLQQLVLAGLARLPITRTIIKRIDYARFTKTLALLLKSGVAITQAVEVALSTVNQQDLRKLAPRIKKQLVKGVSLSVILKPYRIFPSFITQMLSVGEKSGSLDEVLEEIGNYYEQEAQEDLKNITQIIEPVLILLVGIAVGLMVISIISPIYKLIGNLQSQ